jgi:hypothetical protein
VSGIPASARPHHWGFAHAWLRRSFQRIPETIVSAIARTRSAAPVVDAWQNHAKTLDEQDRLPPDGLEAATYSAPGAEGDWYLAVVTFPPPEQAHEAYFGALCVRPPDGQLDPETRERRDDDRAIPAGRDPDEVDEVDEPPDRQVEPEAEHRYLLLERTDDGGTRLVEWVDGEREVLAEPDATGAPAADRQAFVRAVTDRLG